MKIMPRREPEKTTEGVHNNGIAGASFVEREHCFLIVREDSDFVIGPKMGPTLSRERYRESFFGADSEVCRPREV